MYLRKFLYAKSVGFGQSRPPARVFTDDSLQEDADMSYELMKVLYFFEILTVKVI